MSNVSMTLYQTASERTKLVKSLSPGTSLTGYIRGTVDVIRPVIEVQADVISDNYAYITEFGRYYFIDERTLIRTGLTQLRLRCDVLMSYADSIKACYAIFDRADTLNNSLIYDPYQKFTANQIPEIIEFTGYKLCYPECVIMVCNV